MSRILLAAAVVLCHANLFAAEPDGAWTQWRGPNRDGKLSGAQWPDSLDEAKLEQEWAKPLGPSYSGPIVTRDRVFVTETLDRKYEVVRALDRKTGNQIWEARWEGSLSVPFFAKSNGDWIRSTPAYDGERLYVGGMRDVLVCLDATDGKQLWKIDFVEKMKSSTPSFGCVSSPLLIGDHLYIQAGGGLVKLEKKTGEVVWRTLADGGGMNGSAFSSPYYTTLHGRPQLLVQTRSELAGVDPESGDVLWKYKVPAFRGMNILTPTVHDNRVFTSSYGGRSFLFDLKPGEEKWDVEEAWNNKVQGYMSSPIIIDGHAYLHLRNQRFACIDLATGKEKWITKPFGKYWSMIASGDKILALDSSGELLLIDADPSEFKLLSRRKVADDSWAHLAVSGDEIFVRALDSLVKLSWK